MEISELIFELSTFFARESDPILVETIQKLREYKELKELVGEVVDPIIELYSYLLGIPNFQGGDIKYGRDV